MRNNQVQIHTKMRKIKVDEWSKMSEWINQVQPRTEPLIYFCRVAACLMVKKERKKGKTEAKYKVRPPTNVERP